MFLTLLVSDSHVFGCTQCECVHSVHVPAKCHLVQVQKLQSIIASRASQYSHDAKRKEREAAKLKERLSQLLVDRKDKKLGKYTSCQQNFTEVAPYLRIFRTDYYILASYFPN